MKIVGQNYNITVVHNGYNPAFAIGEEEEGGGEETPPPSRYSMTFYVNAANTPDALNSDGNFYNIEFPFSFVQWVDGPIGSDGGATTILNDPFSDYRKTSNDTHTYTSFNYYDVFDTAYYKRLPPISANLDVTIIVENGTRIGSNTVFLGQPYPSFIVTSSEDNTGIEANQAFTETASAGLYVEVRNSGNVFGGGGIGGQGRTLEDNSSDKNNYSGGGGGGGAGLHQQQSSGTYPGQGGAGQAGGANGGSGKGDDSGASQRPAAGAGGGGGQGGTTLRNSAAGARGGDCFAVFNHSWVVSNTSIGPNVQVINKSTGFIISGGGGGGGGGAASADAGDGGNGGALASSGSAGTNGDEGSGAAAGGIAGVANNLNFGLFYPRSGGVIEFTNENGTAGSIKDRIGTY